MGANAINTTKIKILSDTIRSSYPTGEWGCIADESNSLGKSKMYAPNTEFSKDFWGEVNYLAILINYSSSTTIKGKTL